MKKACVIGWPIKHSRSPLIHGYWLKEHRIEGRYEKVAVRPEELAAFLESLAANGFQGCNVTVPHKQQAFALADIAHDEAKAVGAANTLWLDEEGRLHADNTDIYGFMSHLDRSAPGWNDRERSVVLLGAGGAARAILSGLLKAGVSQLRLLNRTRERAEELAASFGAGVEVGNWANRDKELAGCGLLVNATSLGMEGSPPLELSLDALPKDAVVADIVYAPLETALLARARARGCRIVDGLGMLLHQAVPGFERWFGVRPEVSDELRALIVADLKR